MRHVVRISGQWVSCVNVPGYRLTSPDTDSTLWEKLVDAKCRPSYGTQIHMESGDNRFSSRWRRETVSAYTLGYDSRCVYLAAGISHIILSNFFPWIWLLVPHMSKSRQERRVSDMMSDIGPSCWNQTRRNEFAAANDVRTSLEFPGNTWHHIIYGRSLVPSVCLSKPVDSWTTWLLPAIWSNMPRDKRIHGNDPEFLRWSSNIHSASIHHHPT